MKNNLTIADLGAHVSARFDKLLPLQQMDPSQPDFGGVVNPLFGIADPKSTETFILCAGYADLGHTDLQASHRERVLQAADFLLNAQRPDGLIDLLSVNYDSRPCATVHFCFLPNTGRLWAHSHALRMVSVAS